MPTRKPARATGAVPKAQSRNTVPQEAVTPTRRDVHASNLASSLDWVPVSEHQMRGMQQQQQQLLQHQQQQQHLQQQQQLQQQQHSQLQLQQLQNHNTASRKTTNGRLDQGEIDQQLFEGGGRFVPVRPQPRVTVAPRDTVSSHNSDDMSFQYGQAQPAAGVNHGAAAVMIVNPTTPNTIPSNDTHSPQHVQNVSQSIYMGNRNIPRAVQSFRNSSNCVNLAAPNNMNGNSSTAAFSSSNPDRQGATKSSNLLNNGCALLQHTNMDSEMEISSGGETAGICPDSAQVEARLGQIREYIRVTSTLVDNMRNDEDEDRPDFCQEEYEELVKMVDNLKESEGKLVKLLKICPDNVENLNIDADQKIENVGLIADETEITYEDEEQSVLVTEIQDDLSSEGNLEVVKNGDEVSLAKKTESFTEDNLTPNEKNILSEESLDKRSSSPLRNMNASIREIKEKLDKKETIVRPQSVQSNGSSYSDNEYWQNDLKVKMEMSQQRLAALQEQQKQLLKYQADAKQQLADASNHHNRSANESVPLPDTSSNADSLQSHHMYGEESHAAAACSTTSNVEALTSQMATLQHQLSQDSLEDDLPETAHSSLLKEKLRELKQKKKHMENLVAEFQSLRNTNEYAHGNENSRLGAVAATKPIPNLQARQAPSHTQQGVAHPLQGLIYTEQSTSHPLHGLTFTQQGIAHPLQGLTHPEQAILHPHQGLAYTQQGVAHPLQGLTHTEQSFSHPHNGLTYTQQGVAHPLQGLTHAEQGILHPHQVLNYTQQGPAHTQQGALNIQHGPSNTQTVAPESDESEVDIEEPSHDEASLESTTRKQNDDWKITELNAMKEKLERLKGIMLTVDNIENRLTGTLPREEPELDTNSQHQSHSIISRNEACSNSAITEQECNREGQSKTHNVCGMSRLQNYIADSAIHNSNGKLNNQRQQSGPPEPLTMNISGLQQLTEQIRQETIGLAEDRNRIKQQLSRNESEASYTDKKVNSDTDRRQVKPRRSMGPIEMKQFALKQELEEKKKQLEMLINKQMQNNKQPLDTSAVGNSISGESSNTATARAPSVSSAISLSAYSARRPDPDTGYMSEQEDIETCVSSAVDMMASTPHVRSAANISGETVVRRSSLDPYKNGDTANSNSLCGDSMLTFDTWSRSVLPSVADTASSQRAHPPVLTTQRDNRRTDKSHSRTSKSTDKPTKSWRNRQPSMGTFLGETDEETWGPAANRNSAVSAATVPHADNHLTDESQVTSGPVEHSPWWNHKSNQNCQSQTVEQQMLGSPMPSLLPMAMPPMPPITPGPMLMPYGMMSPYWWTGWSQPSMESTWLSMQQRDLLQQCSHQLLHQQREIESLRNSMAHLEEQYHTLANGTISRAHSTPHNIQMAGTNPRNMPVMRAQSAQSNACYTQCQPGALSRNQSTDVLEPPHNTRFSRSNAQFTTRNMQPLTSPVLAQSSPYSGNAVHLLPEPLLNHSELQHNEFTREPYSTNPQMFLNNCIQPLPNPNILNNQFPHPALNNLNPNCLINLPVQNPLSNVPVPSISTQNGALNNQVPPGNRANNYWDNFRSYSRQNLLSTSSKTNSEGHASNIQPLAGRSHNNTLRNPAPLPQPSCNTPKRNTNQPIRDLTPDAREPTQRGRRNITQDNLPTVAPDVLNLNQNIDTENAHVDAVPNTSAAAPAQGESPATTTPANLNINRQTTHTERNLNLTNAIPEIIQGHPNNLNLTRENGSLKKKSSAKLPAKNTPNSNRYALEYAQNRNLDLSTNSDGSFAPNLNLASTSSAAFNEKSTSKLFDLLRENVYSEVTALISANESRPYFLIQLFRDLQQVSSDPLRQRALQSIQEVLMRYTFPSNNERFGESSVHNFDNLTRPTTYPGETGAESQESPLVSISNNESEVRTKICHFIMLHGNEICTAELLEALKNFILNIATEAGLSDVFSDQSLKESLYQYEGLRLCHISEELLHNVLTLCPGYDFTQSAEINRADTQPSNVLNSSLIMQDVAGSLLALSLGNSEMAGNSQNVTGSNSTTNFQSVSSDTVSDSSKGTLKPVVSVIGEMLECGEEYNGDLAEADQSRHREDEEEGVGVRLDGGEADSMVQPTPTEAEAEWLRIEHDVEHPGNQIDLTSEYRKT